MGAALPVTARSTFRLSCWAVLEVRALQVNNSSCTTTCTVNNITLRNLIVSTSYAHCPLGFHSANIKMEGRERLGFEWLPANNSEVQVQSELDDAVAVE